MAGNAQLSIAIRAVNEASKQLKDVQGDITRVGTDADTAAKKTGGFGNALKDMGKIAGGILLAKMFTGFTGAIGSAFGAVEEQARLVKQLDAVLLSTGNTLGTTSGELIKHADALEKVSRADSEAIQGSQALLLTFTSVGKEVFPRATQSILDMSQALGTDLQSATTMVGKALNDPIGGINAMTRAGIQFTDEQKNMIKVMVESGDVMGAQGIILTELEKQFGGSALAATQTLGGQWQQLTHIVTGWAEELIKVALPAILAVVTFLTATAVPAVEKIAGEIKNTLQPAFDAIASIITGTVLPALQDLWGFITDTLVPGITNLGSTISEGFDAIGAVVSGGQVATLTDQLAALSAQLITGMAETENWAAAWDTVVEKVQPAIDMLRPLVEDLMQAMIQAAKDIWAELGPLAEAFEELGKELEPLMPLLEPLAMILGVALVLAIAAVVVQLRITVEVIKLSVLGAIALLTVAVEVLTGVVQILKGAFDLGKAAVDALKDAFNALKGPMGDVGAVMGSFIDLALKPVELAIWAAREAVYAIRDAFFAVRDAIQAVISKIGELINKINIIPSMPNIPGTDISLDPRDHIPFMAAGGIVTKPTLAVIGDAGPEAVVPLSRAGRFFGGDRQPIQVNLMVDGSVLSSVVIDDIYRNT